MSAAEKPLRRRMPEWFKVKVNTGGCRDNVAAALREFSLNTVCAGARCPNLGECFHRQTATFLIMGRSCTRNCKFCAIDHEPSPAPPPAGEADRVAAAAKKLELQFVVVTSVTRDDLPDAGAGCFVDVIAALRRELPGVGVEVLTPDFGGSAELVHRVIDAGPTVFNHNLETVERLSGDIRCRATYRRSLRVLELAAARSAGRIPIKSGLMVGLGETEAELLAAMRDLHAAGVRMLTVGQYLPPSAAHWPLARYADPAEFDAWREAALSIGFVQVASAPLVRSSYRAGALAAGFFAEKKAVF